MVAIFIPTGKLHVKISDKNNQQLSSIKSFLEKIRRNKIVTYFYSEEIKKTRA